MNYALDKDVLGFTKGFTAGAGQFEDPTYLGFRLEFDLDPTGRNQDTNLTDSALFAPTGDTSADSAQRYLSTIGLSEQAAALEKFRTMLTSLSKSTPWFFQGVEGHRDLWKIEKGQDFNNFRGSEKILTVRCLESLDMRVTALAELYRKATFDENQMRWLLPVNLRWFTCWLVIAEIRSFHRVRKIVQASLTNTIANSQNVEGVGPPGPNDGSVIPADPFISTIRFNLGRCEFDFEESFFETVANNDDADVATQSFRIKVGTIKQDSTFPVYGYRLASARGLEKGPTSGTDVTGSTDALSVGQARARSFTTSPINLGGNPILSAVQSRANELATQLTNAPANFIGQQINSITAQGTSAILGNVYNNPSLADAFNSVVGQGQQVVTSIGDVYPEVPEDTSKRNEIKDLGNVYG